MLGGQAKGLGRAIQEPLSSRRAKATRWDVDSEGSKFSVISPQAVRKRKMARSVGHSPRLAEGPAGAVVQILPLAFGEFGDFQNNSCRRKKYGFA